MADPAAPSVEEVNARQHLFRVRYSGPQGSGSLRLVLKMLNETHFEMAVADTLGRSLWSAEVAGSRTTFVDHHQKVYCVSEEEIRLREVTLEMFSMTAIPRILLGRLPVDLEDALLPPGSTESRDEQGRRWSIRTEEDGVAAWTLWVEDAPTLWWTRRAKGGILSHRDGSQFRWRQVVEEPMGGQWISLEPPESYPRVSCHEYDFSEFRQDQPAPAGHGTP